MRDRPSPDASTDALVAVLVDALADATGADPVTMQPPLSHVVDPEALAAVVDSTAAVSVTFDYRGHAVVVRGDGSVAVDGREFAASSDAPVLA